MLQYVLTPTTGLNNIDMEYCQNKNIKIISLRDVRDKIKNITSTAELSFGLILNLVRNISFVSEKIQKSITWDRDHYRSRQLSGMTIGIIGFGRVGSQLSKYCQAMDMKILAYDPRLNVDISKFKNVKFVQLCELVSSSDIISIHATLNKSTKCLINKNLLKKFKKGAYLINSARGEIIDEEAVVESLRLGVLRGLAVDVLKGEELGIKKIEMSPIIKAKREGFNVIIAPHIGGCTIDAMHMTEEIIATHFKTIIHNT